MRTIIDCTTGVPVVITPSPATSTHGMGVLAALIQDEQLDALLQTFDKAGAQDRESISLQIFDRCRDKVQTLIQTSVKGWPLHQADLESLSREAVMETLHARTPRLKRSDCDDWEGFVARLRSSYPPGRYIWNQLTGKLRHEIESSEYLKTNPTIDNLVRELNEIIGKPMNDAAWAGVSLNDAARTLSAEQNPSPSNLATKNIQLLCSAFPMLRPSEQRQPSFWGYLTKAVLPPLKARAAEAGGAAPVMSDHLLESRNQLRGVVEELMAMEREGRLPNDLARLQLPERIHRRQLQQLQERYGPRIAWLNQQVATLSPHPFSVTSPGSLRDAKNLLAQAKIDEKLWKHPSSPYYVPVSGLPSEAIGVQVIRKLIQMNAFPMLERGKSNQSIPAAALPSSSFSYTADEQAMMQFLSGGHASATWPLLVRRLFASDSIEFAIGEFLGRFPQPGRQDIERFLKSLPYQGMAQEIREYGFDQLVLEVDQRVLEAIRDPATRSEISRLLNAQPTAVTAAVEKILIAIINRRVQMRQEGVVLKPIHKAGSGLRAVAMISRFAA